MIIIQPAPSGGAVPLRAGLAFPQLPIETLLKNSDNTTAGVSGGSGNASGGNYGSHSSDGKGCCTFYDVLI